MDVVDYRMDTIQTKIAALEAITLIQIENK